MDPSREITEVVGRFVARVAALAQELAYTRLVDALDRTPGLPTGSAGRPRPRAATPVRTTGAATRAARAVGGRRSPQELERLRQRPLAHIHAQPGQRIEQIKVALGVRTPELAVPLQKLLYADLVRTEGERRATRYFPPGPAGPASADAAASTGTVSSAPPAGASTTPARS